MSSNKIQEAFTCLNDDNYDKFITLVPSEVSVNEKLNARSLIFAAVENRALLCFHYLLQNKADITIRNRKGWNLIHVAVQKKDIKFVLALLNEGVDPNEGDDTGITFF